MSEQTVTGPVGGFQGDLAEAFNPAAGTGCCGSPAANTGPGAPTETGGPCCGTMAEATAEEACCGTAAKADAVATGACGCG
ncbi:hypothetical protein ABH920_004413 [Catenulispora sp. EB89]|uniref:hypothetical protein n=1 Tax=Catenulispora sp. EB89 TaxID=3156257 RepID=UPI0035190F5B